MYIHVSLPLLTHTHSNQLIILSINDPMVNFVSIDVTRTRDKHSLRQVQKSHFQNEVDKFIFRKFKLARAQIWLKAKRRVEKKTRVLNSEKIIILDKYVQPDSDA